MTLPRPEVVVAVPGDASPEPTPIAYALLRGLGRRGVLFWLEPSDDDDGASLCWRTPRQYSNRAVLDAMLEHGPAVAAAIDEIAMEVASTKPESKTERLREIEALQAKIEELIKRLSK